MHPSMIVGQQPYINTMYKNTFVNDLLKLRTIPIEKRGILFEKGNDYFEKKKQRVTVKKVFKKLFNPPDDTFSYPIQKTLRNTNGIFDYIIRELINTNSKYLNNTNCVNLIRKMKRSDRFTWVVPRGF